MHKVFVYVLGREIHAVMCRVLVGAWRRGSGWLGYWFLPPLVPVNVNDYGVEDLTLQGQV